MLRAPIAIVSLLVVAVPAAPLASLAPVDPDRVPDEVLVGFQGPIPGGIEAWVAVQGGTLLMRNDAVHFLAVRLPDAAAAERFLAASLARGDVRYAERDGYTHGDFVPNDPLYGQQWAPPSIALEDAWDRTLGSHNVKVAILDTGITLTHPDLVPNLCGPYASYDGSGTIVDGNGHGTHTSGIAAAATNNGVGVAGASNSCIMGAKVLSAGGSGQWSWLASGITWAADNGARVISMSLSGGSPPSSVSDAVKYAYNTKGVLLVASAGNSGCTTPTQKLGYPAEYDEVMGVGALNPPDGTQVASYSTCGLDLEISAPGSSVLSTWRTGGYATLSGTSMAAPYVAGVAALVFAAIPTLAARDARCLLDLTADEIVGTLPGRDWESGWGRVNARAALGNYDLLVANGLWDEFQTLCSAGAKLITG